MTSAALLTLAVAVGTLVLLATTSLGADLVLAAAMILLIVAGVLEPQAALAGFGNEGLMTVMFLFVVAAGLRETGVSELFVQRVLGQARSERAALARTVLPAGLLSGFINNTPVVAILMPVVNDWARRSGIASSKLLIPLSYAAILGGLCTLVGTSTNLVVNGMLIDTGHAGMRMFDLSTVGVPAAMAGMAVIILLAGRLLPNRNSSTSTLGDAREYTLEMVVESSGPLAGKTIEQAGLRALPGAYLAEINRSGHVLPAVGPEEVLQADDQVVFVGVVDSMVDLQRVPGLRPATTQVFKLDAPRPERVLVEAVVSRTCPVVGQTIREGRFRTNYDAVVLAVSRDGERIRTKIGDIELEAGDTLLLEAAPSFFERRRNSRDFYLVSRLEGASPPNFERRGRAVTVFAAMVVTASFGWLDMFEAAMLAAVGMIMLGCVSATAARRSLEWDLFIAIGASFAIGRAMQSSGAAGWIAHSLVAAAGTAPRAALVAVYIVTVLVTEIVTNNAAAVLMFPIGVATARTLGVDIMPFVIAVTIAASAGFLTPIGYQTNMMVYGPGGYRFSDFVRLGAPVSLTVGVVTLLLIPVFWPF